MSKLRETRPASDSSRSISEETALYLIGQSVARRRELIFGQLHDGFGHHCAIGAFWEDNPRVSLSLDLIDEVAAVNDSVPPTCSARERWKTVNSWLRWKIQVLAGKAKA